MVMLVKEPAENDRRNAQYAISQMVEENHT
jgi:hypothetical protein